MHKETRKMYEIRSLWSNEFSIPLMNIKHCDNDGKKATTISLKLEENKNNEHKIETQSLRAK